jgi:hypothetical protein
MMPDRQGEIAERAYRIWEGEGRPCGRDLDHWLRAEAELGAESASPLARPATKSERPDIVIAAPAKQRPAARRNRRAQ